MRLRCFCVCTAAREVQNEASLGVGFAASEVGVVRGVRGVRGVRESTTLPPVQGGAKRQMHALLSFFSFLSPSPEPKRRRLGGLTAGVVRCDVLGACSLVLGGKAASHLYSSSHRSFADNWQDECRSSDSTTGVEKSCVICSRARRSWRMQKCAELHFNSLAIGRAGFHVLSSGNGGREVNIYSWGFIVYWDPGGS